MGINNLFFKWIMMSIRSNLKLQLYASFKASSPFQVWHELWTPNLQLDGVRSLSFSIYSSPLHSLALGLQGWGAVWIKSLWMCCLQFFPDGPHALGFWLFVDFSVAPLLLSWLGNSTWTASWCEFYALWLNSGNSLCSLLLLGVGWGGFFHGLLS